MFESILLYFALVSNEQIFMSIYLTLDEEFIEELYDETSPVFTNKSSSITSRVSNLYFVMISQENKTITNGRLL